LRWGPLRGAPGAATGATAIGTAATSILTTTIISIRTIISTVTSTARDKGIGSIIRNIAETRRTVIEELRTNSAETRVSNRAVAEELEVVVAPAVLAGSEEPAAQVAQEALEEPAVQVDREALAEPAVQVDQEALEELAVQVAREAPAGLVVQEAVPELETGPVAAELELRTVLVAERELEVVQAEEPVPNQPHGHLAVPEKTKSVTALHPHGLVPLLVAVVDLVAVAQTMREQAAAEAVIAWEVADIVAVAVAVVAVAVE